MVHKGEIRRVVYGKCVVAPPGEGSRAAVAPSQVTVSVRRRRGWCGCLAGSWKEVAVFSFKDRPKAPFFSNAYLDLERLFKYSRKADAGASQVKICVALRSGETRVARVDLDDFMGQLLQSGRLDWFFLYVHEGMVTLMQANIPLTNVPPEWPFDGMASHTHQGPKGEKDITCDDPKVTEPEKSQEKMITDQGVEDNAHSNDNARKGEDVFPAEDKESDVVENGKEIQEETVEDITLTDDEKDTLNDKEESGREAEDSDESDWETLEEWIEGSGDTEEESDLHADEGTDGEDSWETEEEDSDEHSERDSDGSGCETDDNDEGPVIGGSLSFLARLGAAWRHHRCGLLLAGLAALVMVIPNSRQPPDILGNWWWGGAGGEL